MYQVCVRLTRFVWTCFIEVHLKSNMSPTYGGLNHSDIYSGSLTNSYYHHVSKRAGSSLGCLWFDSGWYFINIFLFRGDAFEMSTWKSCPRSAPHCWVFSSLFQSTFIEFPISGIAEPDNFAQQKNTWSNIKSSSPVTFDLDRFENLCDYSVEERRLQKKSGLNLV